MNILKMLEADLRHIERLIDAVAAAEPGSERATVMERLADTIERHLRFEQSWIDPLMARIDGAVPGTEAGRRAMRASIAALWSMVDRLDIASPLERLRSEVDQHALDDERTTFPALRAACPDELLDQLADEMHRARVAARLAAEDRAIAASRTTGTMANTALPKLADDRPAPEDRDREGSRSDAGCHGATPTPVAAAGMTDAA